MDKVQWVHYTPIVTTILASVFASILLSRWAGKRKALHLLWWGMGVVAYGIGTALESTITLFGNSILLNKLWYIAGALLGGYPLAQGSAYLLAPKKLADRLTALTLPFIAVISIFVLLSPVNLEAFDSIKPSGSILGWTWIRWTTPIINLYAVIFLVGGAIYSANRFRKSDGVGDGQRAIGNTLIAVGGILPGIGGTMAKAGVVEALYIGELIGLLFIWAGFQFNVKAPWAPKVETPTAKANIKNS